LTLPVLHKLEYFKTTRWDPAWIDIAKDLIRVQFESRYASHLATETENTVTETEEYLKGDSNVHNCVYLFVFVPNLWSRLTNLKTSSTTSPHLLQSALQLLRVMHPSGLCLKDWVKLKELSMRAGEPNTKLRLTLGNTMYLLRYIYVRKDES
jgi:hypothetical protein